MDAGVGRLRALVIAMIIARVMTGFIFPLFGVLCKWVLVGRYRAGKYPLWGSMYLRWWLTEQTLQIFGKGYFAGSMPIFGNSMLVLYYRMLGAKIGRNVKISKGSQLGQPDLVDVGDDVIFDDAVVRPFSLEERHMVLLPIKIGNSCSVGARSVVASGTTLPDNTHIGPQSSSHELGDESRRCRWRDAAVPERHGDQVLECVRHRRMSEDRRDARRCTAMAPGGKQRGAERSAVPVQMWQG
jgi:non-ribosomal peptide synthetase-like protein